MNSEKKRLPKILKFFQVSLYLMFVFLWFKDNFLLFKNIHISYLIPLIPLLLISSARIFLSLKQKKTKLRLKISRNFAALVILILLAAAVRIPYLANNYGLMDSDEAIPALMGKHISEGKLPPLYYYGAFFQGSLPQHYHALIFKIFGYSIFMVKLSALLAFLAFLGIYFLLVKEIFSYEFALATSLFFCLPFPFLVISSFDIGSGFPVIFFFGITILSLTFSICYKDKTHWVGLLGFLMGLSFWSHQISIIFILTSAFFFILKFRFQLKSYFKLIFYFLIGIFPVLINEFYRNFKLVKLLLSGEAGIITAQKLTSARKNLLLLISEGPASLEYFYLILISAGMGVLFYFSIKKRKILPSILFTIYFIFFIAVYLFSDFSNVHVIRYHFILYLALPVILGSAFLLIPSKVKYIVISLFFLFLFFFSNWKANLSYHSAIEKRHKTLDGLVSALEETGEKSWIADYWVSYLVNSLTEENIMVASSSIVRYPYYKLLYDTAGRNNWIYWKNEPTQKYTLDDTFRKLDIEFKKKESDNWVLFYNIQGDIYPQFLFFPPEDVPEIAVEKIVPTQVMIEVHFLIAGSSPRGGFEVMLEIPGYSSRKVALPELDDKFVVKIPYPVKERLTIRHSLEYLGFSLRSGMQELEYILPESVPPLEEPMKSIEYLSGFGPSKVVQDRLMTVCAKEASLFIRKPLRPGSRIFLHVYSPFSFNDPFWHENFSQKVSVHVNDSFLLEQHLQDGENVIALDSRHPSFKESKNIISLKYQYASILSVNDHWKTSAFLEKVVLE